MQKDISNIHKTYFFKNKLTQKKKKKKKKSSKMS